MLKELLKECFKGYQGLWIYHGMRDLRLVVLMTPIFNLKDLDIYKKYALELVEKGFAYYCFCHEERLEKLREEQRAAEIAVTKYDKHCLNLTKKKLTKILEDGVPYVIRLKVPSDEEVEV